MSKKRLKILLTNDDGIRSNGLVQLYLELSEFTDVTIITPHVQRSGEGKAITINQILRVEEVEVTPKKKGYTINGSSADSIIFALHELVEQSFDLVVSGINQGLNISSHIVLTSGTCAAAFEASFYNIPAIAFSMNVKPTNFFVTPTKETFEKVARVAARIVKNMIGITFPENLAFLNVNFPYETTDDTPTKLTTLAKKFLTFRPELRKDPRKNDYYFLWGDPIKEIPPNSDVEAIFNGQISISPVTNDLNIIRDSHIDQFMEKIMKKWKND